MQVTRPFKGVAVAALTAIGATLALAGPMAGTAFAGKPLPTPQPQITSGPQRPVTPSSTADFVWTVASNTSYTCSLDGGKPSSCVPATSTTHSYTKLADGAHNFVLKAQIQPSAKRAARRSAPSDMPPTQTGSRACRGRGAMATFSMVKWRPA